MSNFAPISDEVLERAKLGSYKKSLQSKERFPEPTDVWMAFPMVYSIESTGLECLTKIDKFLFYQNNDNNCGEEINSFLIKNDLDQIIYTAVEEQKTSIIRIFDFKNREILHFNGSNHVNITTSGAFCGSIWMKRSTPAKFKICDDSGNIVLLIKGPTKQKFGHIFTVLLNDGKTKVGYRHSIVGPTIRTHENFENFNISFPMDLDAKIKALLIIVSIRIDSLFYRNRAEKERADFVRETTSLGFECGHCLASCIMH